MKVRRLRNDELYHYGTKGQKWGKRNYQNLDGSLTPAGRARYSKKVGSSGGGTTLNGDKIPQSSGYSFGSNDSDDDMLQQLANAMSRNFGNVVDKTEEEAEKRNIQERINSTIENNRLTEEQIKKKVAEAKRAKELLDKHRRKMLSEFDNSLDNKVKTDSIIKNAASQSLRIFSSMSALGTALGTIKDQKEANKQKEQMRKKLGMHYYR